MDCVESIKQKNCEMGEVKFGYWVKAARPKTLPVSMAPVVMAVAFSALFTSVSWLPAAICLAFAVMAQVLSNLVNDYADGLKGSDNDRLGPQRMVASGLIPEKTMLRGIIVWSILTFIVGCTLLLWGGWILLPFGLVIMLCAWAYSSGPYPLSRHALGDLAVVLFYGIAPVVLTFFIQTGLVNHKIIIAGLAVGLVADKLLIVNNYRDVDQDLSNGKKTTVGIFGKQVMGTAYCLITAMAVALGFIFMHGIISAWIWLISVVPYLIYALRVNSKFMSLKDKGTGINKLIGLSSLEAIIFALTVTIVIILKICLKI